ncbi:MAG TPA: DUF1501 domain-containing protein, partial [Planctomycetota bacterium]|nr:DUF1501 domain-containing protein [Planctomycetota bacterium]
AAPQGGSYRALVAVNLAGGNDSANLLVPTSAAAYAVYQDSRQDLAVPQGDLLPIVPATPDGLDYGLHPALAPLAPHFAGGRLALVRNVGPLVQPVTKAEIEGGTAELPPKLYSHNDQTVRWMSTSASELTTDLGWGGVFADELLALNGGAALSPSISLQGTNELQVGALTQPYSLGTNGSIELEGFTGSLGSKRWLVYQQLLAKSHANLHREQFAAVQQEAVLLDVLISAALDAAPPLATPFPATSLGNQLKMVARMVGIRAALGMARQVFFVRQGGYDTHADQNEDQPVLLGQLADALAAFQAAMAELSVEDEVVAFTVSEFGRTLSSNGKGTDHGWGGHQLVLGGGVAGGDLYGTMPSLALDGPDDAGSNGRLIPTTSVDQMAATLGLWFGVAPAALPTLLPNLANFATTDLGFMA